MNHIIEAIEKKIEGCRERAHDLIEHGKSASRFLDAASLLRQAADEFTAAETLATLRIQLLPAA